MRSEQLSQVFARFWRGTHRRDHGAGLGLAIRQEIARAHRRLRQENLQAWAQSGMAARAVWEGNSANSS
ncbi:hypothetical protein [Pseudomonas sp. Z3-8]|uniref:hypothetical protein n=1 Tax=Pseudomonas sp. Z3-8 TaxID=2817412 RepID=UPI003DA91422